MENAEKKNAWIVISAYTGVMLCHFPDMHEFAEKTLGYPIFTHEFADKTVGKALREKLQDEYKNAATRLLDLAKSVNAATVERISHEILSAPWSARRELIELYTLVGEDEQGMEILKKKLDESTWY